MTNSNFQPKWWWRHLVAKQLQKFFDLWSTPKYSKVSKICSACSSISFKVSYMLKPTVQSKRSLWFQLTLLIQNKNQCQERQNNTGGNNSWAEKQNIQEWHQNFYEGILAQWPEVLPDFEHPPYLKTQRNLSSVLVTSTPVSRSAQICGHQHSHSGIVAPGK